ncbi:MAG: hypothetical protein QGG84_01500 [Rhodospirillales bacterium]|nr:hypothetical protein [Rhodospirillales bacterium]
MNAAPNRPYTASSIAPVFGGAIRTDGSTRRRRFFVVFGLKATHAGCIIVGITSYAQFSFTG